VGRRVKVNIFGFSESCCYSCVIVKILESEGGRGDRQKSVCEATLVG